MQFSAKSIGFAKGKPLPGADAGLKEQVGKTGTGFFGVLQRALDVEDVENFGTFLNIPTAGFEHFGQIGTGRYAWRIVWRQVIRIDP